MCVINESMVLLHLQNIVGKTEVRAKTWWVYKSDTPETDKFHRNRYCKWSKVQLHVTHLVTNARPLEQVLNVEEVLINVRRVTKLSVLLHVRRKCATSKLRQSPSACVISQESDDPFLLDLSLTAGRVETRGWRRRWSHRDTRAQSRPSIGSTRRCAGRPVA